MREKFRDSRLRHLRGLSVPALALLFAVAALLTGCSDEGGSISATVRAGFDGVCSSVDKPQADDGLLILVNPWNVVPEDYEVELVSLSDGTLVAEACYDDLRELLKACRGAGCAPYICSAYRTQEYQSSLFENKVARLMDSGLDEASARVEAAKVVALPGTSEHQLGLALDIIDSGYPTLDEGQGDTATQRWLMENSWRYGFILRYPEGKSAVTGIIYEPWHYRYVGREAAAEIYQSGLCFEEWLAGN